MHMRGLMRWIVLGLWLLAALPALAQDEESARVRIANLTDDDQSITINSETIDLAAGEVTDYQTYEIDSSVGFGYSIGFSSSFTSLTPDTDYALVIYINGSGDIKTVLLNETRYFGTVLFDDAATLVLINALDTDDFGVDPAAVGLVLESDAGRVGLTLAALEAFTEPNVLTVSAGDYTLSVQQIGSDVEIAPPSDLSLEAGARRLVIITGLSDTQEDYGLSVLTLPD